MYSLLLSVATPSAVVYLNIRQLEFYRITILTRVVIFFCVFETVPFLLFVWWVGLSFLCGTLSCSVWFRICVQSGRVQMEYRGGGKDGAK